jgi:hypothetical protein
MDEDNLGGVAGEAEQEIALLAYLGDADQYHLGGIEPGDEVPASVPREPAKQVQANRPAEPSPAESVEAAEETGLSLSPWWLCAVPPILFGAGLAWSRLRRTLSRRRNST